MNTNRQPTASSASRSTLQYPDENRTNTTPSGRSIGKGPLGETNRITYRDSATLSLSMLSLLGSLTPAERNAIRALRWAEREALVKADKGLPQLGFVHARRGPEAILLCRSPGSRQRKARKAARRGR